MESAIAGDQATQARKVVERAVDALVRRDLEAYLETLGDDVVWEGMGMDYLPNGSRYEGKDAIVRDLLPTLTEVYDLETLAFDVRGIVADGPNVVVEWVVNAKTPLAFGGRSYVDVPLVGSTRVKLSDGRVVSLQVGQITIAGC